MAKDYKLDRRGFMLSAGGAAAAAVLAGCGSAGSTGAGPTNVTGGATATGSGGLASGSATGASNTAAASATVPGLTMPTYVAYTALKPDLPALPDGTAPGFYQYPADPPKVSTGAPASGGSVEALCVQGTPPRPLSGNKFWQELNKQLGAELKYLGTPASGYIAKFQTVMAGGSIPDIIQILPGTPQVPGLVKSKCQDLTPFLAGDAIKEYPGLANIPPLSWKSTVYDGAIYAVPINRFALRFVPLVRDDLIKGVGLDPNFTSGAEFLALCKGVTNLKKSEWAFPEPWAAFFFVNEMVGTPNQWAVAAGKFTRDYETEQMRQALGILGGMWKDGVINPDGFGAISGSTEIGWLVSGKTKMFIGAASWQNIGAAVKADDPNKSLVPVSTPKWEGGGAAKSYLGSAIYSVQALKKASDDRIQEVLRVMDWLAAPWGTQEQILRTQGIKGWDYTIDDGAYVRTENGKAEMSVPTLYISACPIVHFSANKDITKLEYEAEKEGMANGEPLPTVGLYSDTALTKGVTLDKTMQALQGDVIQGRKSLSDWDRAVKSWRSGGGDAIRSEYEKAWAAAHS